MVGTSLEDLTQDEFRAALELASPTEQCPIRANLAIAIEREGDLAQHHAHGVLPGHRVERGCSRR